MSENAWSIINTAFLMFLTIIGWGIKRSVSKINHISNAVDDLEQNHIRLEAQVKALDHLDDSRFADHERWLERLDSRISATG